MDLNGLQSGGLFSLTGLFTNPAYAGDAIQLDLTCTVRVAKYDTGNMDLKYWLYYRVITNTSAS
jgi:hypothetical protein